MKGNRLWLLGTVAAVAVIVVLGWLLGVSPKLASADLAAAEQATVDQGNLIQQAELEQLRQKNEEIDVLRAEVDVLRKGIPGSVLSEDFVDDLVSKAASTGVNVTRISLSEPAPWGASLEVEGGSSTAEDEGSAAPPVSTATDGVFTVAVTIDVTGPPEAVIAFSRLAQEGDRLLLVDNFSYAGDPELKATLTGYTFVYVDPSSRPLAEETAEAVDSEPAPSDTPTPTETPAP